MQDLKVQNIWLIKKTINDDVKESPSVAPFNIKISSFSIFILTYGTPYDIINNVRR